MEGRASRVTCTALAWAAIGAAACSDDGRVSPPSTAEGDSVRLSEIQFVYANTAMVPGRLLDVEVRSNGCGDAFDFALQLRREGGGANISVTRAPAPTRRSVLLEHGGDVAFGGNESPGRDYVITRETRAGECVVRDELRVRSDSAGAGG